jgi:hypothetical protein
MIKDPIDQCYRLIQLIEENAPKIIIDNEVNNLTELLKDYKQHVSPVRLVLSPEEEENNRIKEELATEELTQTILDIFIYTDDKAKE